LFEPLLGRVFHHVLNRENRRIDLGYCLHGVAAVGEQRRALGEYDGRAGRTGEAGEPGEAFFTCRQVFVLLAIGARHDETVEATEFEFGTQGGDAGRALPPLARLFECLETGLDHGGGTLACRSGRATQACGARWARHVFHGRGAIGAALAGVSAANHQAVTRFCAVR